MGIEYEASVGVVVFAAIAAGLLSASAAFAAGFTVGDVCVVAIFLKSVLRSLREY